MPVHQFTHDPTGETIEVYVAATAPTSEHQRQTKDGKVYKRVYAMPLTATNMATRIGDGTRDDFRKCVDGKKGLKLGDTWEISAEMSAKRAERNNGLDPVKEEGYAKWLKETGKKHPDVVAREKAAKANAKLAEWGIKVVND
jgi:hypothetical protein